MTHALLRDVETACVPASAMGRLAPLRGLPDVEIALHDRDLWIRWRPGNEPVAELVFAIASSRLYVRRDDHWYGWGRATPAFEVPDALRFRPLDQAIFPAAVQPASASLAPRPMVVALTPDPVARPTLALSCSLQTFCNWAETMPACALERFRAAISRQPTGDQICVLGRKLPWLEGAERFCGRTVLVPLGMRVEPQLSEACLRTALGIDDADLLVIRHDACDIIPHDRFTPVNHAALRLACGLS